MQQYPCSFEYNEEFLEYVAAHLHSNKFGTFLHDREKDRAEANVTTRTMSIWVSANKNKAFHNPFYVMNQDRLLLNVQMRAMSLWPYYLRFSMQSPQTETLTARAVALLWREKSRAATQRRWLEKKVASLRAELPDEAS